MNLTRYLTILLYLSPISSFAGYSGVWADSCENGKNAFILSRSSDTGPYQLLVCSGFKCIPMPGMRKPITVENNPAIQIVNENEMVLKGKTYQRCQEIHEPHFEEVSLDDVDKNLIGTWVQVAQMRNGAEGPVSSYYYKNALWDISTQTISSKHKDKVNWTRSYSLDGKMIVIYIKEDRPWRHYNILRINNKRLYLSEMERPSEAIRIFEKK